MVLFSEPHSQSSQQSNTTRRAEPLPSLRRRLTSWKDRMFIHIPYPKHGLGQTLSDSQRKVLAGGLRSAYSEFNPVAMKRNSIKLSPTRSTALHWRPALERMMRMHERLKAGRYPNCRKLADELEVSSKTVQRDIDFMRYRLGLPIEYDQLHFGFYYTEPVANFPNIEISEGELIALYIGQKALTQSKGTSFEAPAIYRLPEDHRWFARYNLIDLRQLLGLSRFF